MSKCKNTVNLVNQSFGSCGDSSISIENISTTNLNNIDTTKEFNDKLFSELINVKTRQTSSNYPTLKLIYERYRFNTMDYISVKSSAFNYFDMDAIGTSVDNYWIDLMEQMVPATTIWGSTYTYRNTVFDTQKFKYRNSNAYFINNPGNQLPGNPIATTNNISVEVTSIPRPGSDGIKQNMSNSGTGAWVMTQGSGSEFLGKVIIPGLSSNSISEKVNTFNGLEVFYNEVLETYYIVTEFGEVITSDDGSFLTYED